MRRIVALLIVVTATLVGLLAVRLRAQEAALRAPTGGSGTIEGAEIRLAAKLSSRVTALHTSKGSAVKAGDILVALDCAEPEAVRAEAEARLVAARAQARAARSGADAARGTEQAASSSVLASKAQALAVRTQRDNAQKQADRVESVGNDVAASTRDQARASASSVEHQLEAAQAASQAAGEQAKAASKQASAASAQADAADAAIGVAEAALARALLLVAECQIRAPRDGTVEELPFLPGELVGPGTLLAKLIDLGEAKATFYVPNAELAAVKPGALVIVKADAYPEEEFRGKVVTVGLKAEFTPRNIQTRTDRDRLVYPVEVSIPNPAGRLRAGMPVDVRIPGTER